MQALAVYPAPVSAVAVDFLLRPVSPTIDAAPILARLVRRQLVRFQDRHYHLHPVDREYARSRLLGDLAIGGRVHAGGPAGPRRGVLRSDPGRRGSPGAPWRTSGRRWPSSGCAVTPATTTPRPPCWPNIDFRYLQLWGHYRTLTELHGRIHGRITDPALNAIHLGNLANCHMSLVISGRSTCTPRRWPSPATPATVRARPASWATWRSCRTAWATTSGRSTCSPGAGHRPRHRRPPRRELICWRAWDPATLPG